MKKGETYFERLMFSLTIIFKMILPPFYSLKRLEGSCRSWLNKNPNAYTPREFMADLYRFYKKNEEAKEQYLEIRRLGYMTERDQLNFTEVLFRLQDYRGIIETLLPIINKYPLHADANFHLGISLMKLGDYDKASRFLQKVILAGRKRFEDYWWLGYCFDQLGDLENAEEVYRKALQLNPHAPDLKQNIVSIYIRKAKKLLDTDLEAAKEEVRKALEVSPANPQAAEFLDNLTKLQLLDHKTN